MSEFLVKMTISAAGTYSVPIKNRVLGVYSSSAVKVGWDFNGETAEITPTAATVWEPRTPFNPAPTSKLIITATAAANVTIRME